MSVPFLDLHKQYLSIKDEIDAAIADVIGKSAFVGGAAVREFEAAFAAYQGAGHCVGMGNGSDALEIAIESLELPPGSEIIVPANTFVATSEAVTRAGHRVVFADVDDTCTLDCDDVACRITPRTAAIIPVHIYGQPCDMTRLMALADKHGLRVIEDCAQAHGANFVGKPVGTIGHLGIFSFFPGKNLGAYGDGGAVVTNDENLARRCRMIANHGGLAKYSHEIEGRNSRLDGLQAAILRVKLDHLDEWTERRIQAAAAYDAAWADLPDLGRPRTRDGVRHVYHLYVVFAPDRDGLAAFLHERGIQTGIHYPTILPALPAYAHLEQDFGNSQAAAMAPTLLSLPMGDHLDDALVQTVAAAVREYFPAQ